LKRRRAGTLTALCLVGAAAAGAVAACQTVDLGTPPADLNACRPSQLFFVSDIWPNVLSKDYSGRHCYDSSCHDAGIGRPLTLVPIPGFMPDAGTVPVPLTGVWATNYASASEQMNCSNASASQLFLLPTNTLTHGGQQLFAPVSDEARTVLKWPSVHP
jgi:hypothetical protein